MCSVICFFSSLYSSSTSFHSLRGSATIIYRWTSPLIDQGCTYEYTGDLSFDWLVVHLWIYRWTCPLIDQGCTYEYTGEAVFWLTRGAPMNKQVNLSLDWPGVHLWIYRWSLLLIDWCFICELFDWWCTYEYTDEHVPWLTGGAPMNIQVNLSLDWLVVHLWIYGWTCPLFDWWRTYEYTGEPVIWFTGGAPSNIQVNLSLDWQVVHLWIYR